MLEVLSAMFVPCSAGTAAIHEACSLYNTSQFQAERGKFQESVGQKLVTRYNELKCDVSEIQVSEAIRENATLGPGFDLVDRIGLLQHKHWFIMYKIQNCLQLICF